MASNQHGNDMREKLQATLKSFIHKPLKKAAIDLLNTLGYSSNRRIDIPHSDPGEFLKLITKHGPDNFRKDKALFDDWIKVDILFQLTDEELSDKMSLFQDNSVNTGLLQSYLFFAIELKQKEYARGKLTAIARQLNRIFPMPVMVLIKHGDLLSIAVINRRRHKQDSDRDVLGKVTIIRDISLTNPHRGHLDILNSFALQNLKDIHDFDTLHTAWEEIFNVELLSKRFYTELLGWFEWAVETAKFPNPENKPIPKGDHVIRLITRILFVWFIKEKQLVSEDLFIEAQISPLLKKYNRDNDDYYRAILQNLFFATLNTEITQRDFSQKKNTTHRNFNLYRYKDLLENPTDLLDLMKHTPFINGGLFDCLDSEETSGDGGYRLDCFSDNKQHRQQIYVPNFLFFDDQRGLFPLLNKYKFTVEENTPVEQEVALDPELLGKVFENLLAACNPESRETARKQTGSYYTPRAIVDYMVDEALVASLAERVKPMDDDTGYWQERLHYLLDYADAFDDANELFENEEISGIVKAISEIKALDPAVGSGAFPMGILHKLTLALRRIDPKNKIWEKLQKDRARQRADAAFDTKDDDARSTELQEINATFKNYRDSDFGRKLYLIQNSIFGVDIQPIACQIAKLRFFISLAIEQQSNADASENFGIKPLPNLETRFIAANTLIGLQLTGEDLLESTDIKDLEKRLQQNRERHFNADTHQKQLDCAKKDKALRHDLARVIEANYQRDIVWKEAKRIVSDELTKLTSKHASYHGKISASKQLGLLAGSEDTTISTQRLEKEIAKLEETIMEKQTLGQTIVNRDASVKSSDIWNEAEKKVAKGNAQIHAEAQKIVAWDPCDQNAKADWFDAEWMYGIRDGFDIVIGNPPYVQLQRDGGTLGKLYQNQGYTTFTKTGDIYQLFYEKGHSLLNDEGYCCYITSNKWMRSGYGKKLRKFFAEQSNPQKLLDFGGFKVFENATVDTNILLTKNTQSQQQLQAVHFKKDFHAGDSISDYMSNNAVGLPNLTGDTWVIGSAAELALKEKIERMGKPLKEWDISINYGIKTGYNEAFIVNNETKEALVAADPKSAEILKPILRGRDIQRYRTKWAGLWLIDTHNGYKNVPLVDINDYPAVKRHLDKFYSRLEKREDKGSTPYNLRSCAYHAEFAKEKLVWTDIAKKPTFQILETEIYFNNTVYMIIGDHLRYIVGVLNSSLNAFYFPIIATDLGTGANRYFKQFVEKLPIPLITDKNRSVVEQIENLVNEIRTAEESDTGIETTGLEEKINHLIYQIYDLNEAEISTLKS